MANQDYLKNYRPTNIKKMLQDLEARAQDYEQIVIIARKKDGGSERWSTTTFPWFLFGASMLLSDLAQQFYNGDIEPGP